MSKHVTRTGRALRIGRVTRKTYTVKRAHDGRPLPMELQCHPPKCNPTPVHPECATLKQTQLRGMLGMYLILPMDFILGVLLDHRRTPSARAEIRVTNVHGNVYTYYHASLHTAWVWAELARECGLKCDVFDITPVVTLPGNADGKCEWCDFYGPRESRETRRGVELLCCACSKDLDSEEC